MFLFVIMYHLNLGILNVLFPVFGSGRMRVNNANKLEVSLFLLYHLKLGMFECFLVIFAPCIRKWKDGGK